MKDGLDYWDWVSTQDKCEYVDNSFKTVIKENFNLVRSYLDSIFWVEANVIYLNQLYGISQTEIAKYLGISQLGVSKRLHSGLKRIQIRLLKPKDNQQEAVCKLREVIKDPTLLQVASLYYHFNNRAIVARICNISIRKLGDLLKQITEILDLSNHEYFAFFKQARHYETTGDYLFKRDS